MSWGPVETSASAVNVADARWMPFPSPIGLLCSVNSNGRLQEGKILALTNLEPWTRLNDMPCGCAEEPSLDSHLNYGAVSPLRRSRFKANERFTDSDSTTGVRRSFATVAARSIPSYDQWCKLSHARVAGAARFCATYWP